VVSNNDVYTNECWRGYNVVTDFPTMVNDDSALTKVETESDSVVFRAAVVVKSEAILNGETFVSHTETRIAQDSLTINIAFPASVVVSAGIEIFSAIDVEGFLVSHIMTVDSFAAATEGKAMSASLRVSTVVQIPFTALPTSPTVSVDADSDISVLSVSAAAEEGGCDDPNSNDECVQFGILRWTSRTLLSRIVKSMAS